MDLVGCDMVQACSGKACLSHPETEGMLSGLQDHRLSLHVMAKQLSNTTLNDDRVAPTRFGINTSHL